MAKKLIIIDVVEPAVKIPDGPPPSPELGKNLQTLEDAERWLLHPSNWITSSSQIVYWDGNTPRLAKRHALRLLKNPQDRPGLFGVIIRDQFERKHPNSEKNHIIFPEEQS